MLTPSSIVLGAAALLPLADLASSSSSAPRPKVVGMQMRRDNSLPVPLSSSSARRLRRRDKNIQIDIANEPNIGGYFLNISVGTPPQPISVLVDTGSSDLWIPAAGADICSGDTGTCDLLGAFESTSSSSFSDISKDAFNISYGDGTQILGDYVSDTVQIADAKVTNATMGLAFQGQSDTPITGIIGIGYSSHETNVRAEPSLQYPNIPELLQQQGFTNTKAYSLWLNDLDSSTGNILFGGVDSGKYTGPLMTLPTGKNAKTGKITEFIVTMTSLSFYGDKNTTVTDSNYAIPVLLDSGTSLSALPDQLIQSVWNGLGVIDDDNFGPLMSCKYAVNSDGFAFGFGGANGVTITVPMDELLSPAVNELGETLVLDNGDDACKFSLRGGGDDEPILGDAFMRSAYLVYDLDNNQIAMAQTKFNSTQSNVQEITGKDIPGATVVSNAASATESASPTGQDRPSQAGGLGETGTATASRIGGGGASPTFQLSTAMASTSKASAPSVVHAPSFSAAAFAAAFALGASFLGGFGLLVL